MNGALLELAARHRVRPMVHDRLRALGGPAIVPAPFWQDLVDTCRTIAIRNLELFGELTTLSALFAREGVPMIALIRGRLRVELHVSLTPPSMSYSMDPAGVWARARPVPNLPAHVMGLGNEDLLLHLCAHTA
jgi:hypothetical protein